MSSTSYSRNKYRCLLRSNHNVIVSNDNIAEPKPSPQPHIYHYGYPGYVFIEVFDNILYTTSSI
uniref:Uncharacterized protein n=1 Tax=viral metagenome TaxID=1070528 RepID=A0A6C0D2H1_9ZZZZ